ncbi:hypothetical protein HPB50_013209 [Hyalomma asiaticum]|uniref:Uncharacterized protein n=1 Tax=Hyalomma asiaticum TaxID=266040 RepID=A0ACB7S057_HYAAI|nr:hypothetical protein HPB50_013209 [Hyalomma asiaticum]
MLGDYGSKYAKRDDDATRSSRRDLSPPRKTPSMTSRVRGDIERRIDVRDGRWSPDAPPYYSSPPRRISSKTRPGHDDYESRSYRRRSEHSPSPSHKASRTSRAYSDIQLSSTRWSGARRTDSPTGGSSPRWQSASKSSRLYDGNKPRAYYTRSEDDSPDSPHDRPIHPPRTYSQTSRVRGDIEPSSDRRSGTRKMYSSLHSPSLLRSVYSEAYNMPGASTRKHSRREDGGSLDSSLDHSISPRRSGRADEDSRDDWWSGHRLDSAHERSIFLQRTPETYRVRGGLETATAQKIGERRTDRPVELGSPPKGKAFKATAAIGNYKSGANLRQPPESSSEPAPPKDTSKEVKTRAYSEPSAIRQSDVPKASSPLHRINISKMVSSKATSGHTKSEPEKEGRSGSFRPSSQSDHTDPPKRKPSSKASAPQGDTDPNAVRRTRDPKSTATEGTTLSTRKESASRGDTRTDVPLDFKPVSNVDKSSGKADAGASGRRPGDTATTGNAAEPNKTAKDAPADADAAHRKYSYVPLEETEEIQIPKAPETPPSEEYIPPSQVGHAATKVDESLGPFSDDDDDDGDEYQEVDVDDSRFGWFRLWVLCSVAALVLLLPFALTIMSYDAVAWIQKSGARVTGGLLRNLSYFPLLHCTDIIVYSLHYISTTKDVEPKRRIFVGGDQVLPFASAAYHSYRKVNVYATLGGSRADSPALAMASSDAAAVAAKLRDIVSTNKYTGVNFDWDRPNDECDSERNGLLLLLKEFSDVGDRVLVTIAPDADIVKKHYPLLTVPLPQVEYVIVATHRLRAEGVVSCSGGQIEAALAYWAIRKLLEPVFTEKVIYSTAFGGDVYFSKTTRLLSYGTPLSPFHGLTQGIPKISYTDICKLTPVNVTDDCSLYLLERNDSGYKGPVNMNGLIRVSALVLVAAAMGALKRERKSARARILTASSHRQAGSSAAVAIAAALEIEDRAFSADMQALA